MQAAKKVAINTGFLYGRMAITIFISLYSTRLILEALGAKDFGIFNVVGGVILILGFLNASMSEATQRFMSFAQGSGNTTKLKQIFNISIVLHFLIAVLLFILLELAGLFIFDTILNIPSNRISAAKLVYHYMILSTIFTIASVPYDAAINARENMLLFTVIGISESIFRLIIALYITNVSADKLITYGATMAIIPALLLAMRIWYCNLNYKECKIDIKPNFDFKLLKEMTAFAGWSLIGTSTSMISNYGQGIILNVFFGTAINAAQGIANQVSGQLGTFAHTLMRALNPTLAKSEGAGDRELMIKAAILGSKVSFFLLMLMIVPVLIEMPFIFTLWLKDIPEYTIIFCKLLLIRNLIEQMFFTLVHSIVAVGKIKKFQLVSSILSCFPLIITYFMYKGGYPPYTLYLNFAIYSVIASLVILIFSKRSFDLSLSLFFYEVISRCTAAFLISVTISSIPALLLPESLQRLLTTLTLSIILFVLLFWFLGLNKSEHALFKNIVSTTYNKYLSKNKLAIAVKFKSPS